MKGLKNPFIPNLRRENVYLVFVTQRPTATKGGVPSVLKASWSQLLDVQPEDELPQQRRKNASERACKASERKSNVAHPTVAPLQGGKSGTGQESLPKATADVPTPILENVLLITSDLLPFLFTPSLPDVYASIGETGNRIDGS